MTLHNSRPCFLGVVAMSKEMSKTTMLHITEIFVSTKVRDPDLSAVILSWQTSYGLGYPDTSTRTSGIWHHHGLINLLTV